MVSALRRRATERKLLLLEYAICRHAPFSSDGKTIWDLLPDFAWFEHPRVSSLRDESLRIAQISAHEAIANIERMADGECSPVEVEDTRAYLLYTEYAAESDRIAASSSGCLPPPTPGSELRYGVADWIMHLADTGPTLANVLDYYYAAYDGMYSAWAHNEPLHPDHQTVAFALIRDIFGDPAQPVAFDPTWRTDTAVSLARHMYESRDFSALPILADALQDAGCEHADILTHCRDESLTHVRGCWVVDLVLGKE